MTQTSKKIVVGMAAYNGEGTIGASIRSLLNQSHSNLELIISDDGSCDKTLSIIENFAKLDSRIRVFSQMTNLGPLGNFNFVLELAEAEYFMWASQDDLWNLDFIGNCLQAIERAPSASYAIPRWICESRTIPYVRRIGLPNMYFLENTDPVQRMLEFTALPFTSFKDNLTYGVFKRADLWEVMSVLSGKVKYFSIGNIHNEYTVLKMKGVVVRKAILRKRYKYFPPGHLFDKMLAISRILSYRNKKKLYPVYTAADHLSDLETVLREYGVADEVVAKAIYLNKLHLNDANY
ncbi:MAG: hypothetical protein B7X82_15025 [Hydrogenophilales bacterium 17-64-65]|nr:MAG: hypothetical protein B7Y27_10995 [Hydrogenophilales bacterium 16-64-40]OZA31873.1 MAG: hypothetical protein B7X82_15025 [Hydrogenophilales bacterium 17-64-65]